MIYERVLSRFLDRRPLETASLRQANVQSAIERANPATAVARFRVSISDVISEASASRAAPTEHRLRSEWGGRSGGRRQAAGGGGGG